jgi:3-dehydroquinate dehydratase
VFNWRAAAVAAEAAAEAAEAAAAEAAVAVISGLGLYGYVLAVEGLAKLIEDQPDIGSTA